MKPYIVGHVSPDMDCIVALWLLRRFDGKSEHDIVFVNTGNPDPIICQGAAAIVDTGGLYNPYHRRFDHHQYPTEQAALTCAAKQVWECLILEGQNLEYLEPLINLTWHGDIGSRDYGAEFSRELGLHAILSSLKVLKKHNDLELYERIAELLDLLEYRLKLYDAAKKVYEDHVVYRSVDGFVVALLNAPEHSSSIAFENGARVVLFQNSYPIIDSDSVTHAIGAYRAGEWKEPHLGRLLEIIIESVSDKSIRLFIEDYHQKALIEELESWYQHKGGFYCGRGGLKAPRFDPIKISLLDIAGMFDTVWKR